MPVNYQQIKNQITTWGQDAPGREQKMASLREQCRALLQALDDPAALAAGVEAASRHNPHLRTAAPAGEDFRQAYPLPALADNPLVLAADGSQINPDRHAAVEFCVINTGAFYMQAGGAAPCEKVESTLLAAGDLYNENGLITEEVVALRRDLMERQYIARLAGQLPAPVVTLTDGPLELYMERGPRETREFRQLFDDYLDVLAEIADLRVVTAGYVDKPHADLVVRLLEISQLEPDQLDQAGKTRPYLGLIDSDLFNSLLQPGQRSAVFGIVSQSARSFEGVLALHFFYFNAGRQGKPWIARVEIPAWVAQEKPALDRLHAVLDEQCRMLGEAAYPYVLHRAHEVAVVRMPEREMIEGMLQAELYRRGLAVGVQSHKQTHKNQAGRTRIGRK